MAQFKAPNAKRCGRIWNLLLSYQLGLDVSGEPSGSSKGYTYTDEGIFKVISPTGTSTSNECKYALVGDERQVIIYNASTGNVTVEGL